MSRSVSRVSWVVVWSLLIGGLTWYGQGRLPQAVYPVSDSESGWMLVTVVLLWWARLPTLPSAVAGAASFVSLTQGYTVASDLRGYPYHPAVWLVISIVGGPMVGIAVAWLRQPPLRAALGCALIAGIGIADAAYGLSTTSHAQHPYWWAIAGASVGLLVVMAVCRIRRMRALGVAVGGTATVMTTYLWGVTALSASGLG